MKLFRVFFSGLMISLLGALPLGTLNVSAMQLSATVGVLPAISFSIGALLVEMAYVRLSLAAMDYFRAKNAWFRIMEWLSLFLIVALAVASFAGIRATAAHSTLSVDWPISPFWSGVVLSALNPLQIPFWFGWTTALFSRNLLFPGFWVYYIYIIGIGLGTFLGNGIFIWGGYLLVNSMPVSQNLISWITGTAFAVAALIQAYHVFIRKSSADQ